MKHAGRLLLIFGAVALIGAIMFGITVAAFGVVDGNYGISIGDNDILRLGGIDMGGFFTGNPGVHWYNGMTKISEEFEKNKEYKNKLQAMDGIELKDISISLASCKAGIACAAIDEVWVTYKTGDMKTDFSVELDDGVLTITEKSGSWFNFGSFKSSELTLTLPERIYNSIKFELASGRISSDVLKAENMKGEIASGTMDINVYARNMKFEVASGKLILTNCSSQEVVRELDISAASGSVELNGYKADKTDIDLASGSVTANGISGGVNCDLASGHVVLNYAEWNGDLSVHLASGKTDVTLPAGSGADVSFKRASGNMKLDLDGQSASMTGNSNMTVGGSNVHKIDAETLSGSITVHN